MKKSQLYWHRTLYALKKIPSFFRDWEETVSAETTPDLICECMEEHPHLVAKHLAFLMSAPASVFEKNQIWTHVFIKALELGRHDIADIADRNIPHKGWTALASLPFNSPILLKKYWHKDVRNHDDFKTILLNFVFKNYGINSLHEYIGFKDSQKVNAKLHLPDGISREHIVKQLKEYQKGSYETSGGLMLPSFAERMRCVEQIGEHISQSAQDEDPRAYLILNFMEYQRFRTFQRVVDKIDLYAPVIQQQFVENLPQWVGAVDGEVEAESMYNAVIKILSSPAGKFITQNAFVKIMSTIAQNEFFTQNDEIFEHTPSDILDHALTQLHNADKLKLSQRGPLTTSLIQRHTLMGCTQSAPSTLQRRKM